MAWYRGPEGDQRIWYEEAEIEQMMSDELSRASLAPTLAAPVVDLEKFIEVYLKADLDQYADLPVEVLGLTQFTPGKPPKVSINNDLTAQADTGDPAIVGRWRATLAHEGAHVLLHRYLFEPDFAQPDLFGGALPTTTPGGGLMRCLKRDLKDVQGLGPRRSRDWREIQANRGMAALLMPKTIFRRIASQRVAGESLTDLAYGSREATHLASLMANIFSVSRQAAAIRLETLGIVTRGDTARLPGM